MLYLLFLAVSAVYFFYLVTSVLPKENWAFITLPAALVYGTCVFLSYKVPGNHEIALWVMLAMAAIFGVWALAGELLSEPDSEKQF
ncbi:hypothetical protein [Marinobacter sp. CHS3-4]|uniref:hypothetical protein n=1 Tax=Marinobacter sp. CHS3-4 TaxID=3045174 RepID=UPI0024B5FED0|nr:hypothetical protein [Marinobacter sp. CHS3-4]MDI9246943.1 hypothetical protein [Marinobacter sp. CHS3-4]